MSRDFIFCSGSSSFNPVYWFQNPFTPIMHQDTTTTSLPIEITIFWKITSPVSLILIIASFIFTSNPSPTSKGLSFLLNFSGGSLTLSVHLKTYPSNWWQLYVLKCTADIFHEKCVTDGCVPYLCASLSTLYLTFEGKSIWYFFFSLHEFFNSVLKADTSATLTL